MDQGLGDVEANGFRIEDGAYVNDAYDTSDVIVDVEINQGAGGVDLQLAE